MTICFLNQNLNFDTDSYVWFFELVKGPPKIPKEVLVYLEQEKNKGKEIKQNERKGKQKCGAKC